jgi:hypothetical protein
MATLDTAETPSITLEEVANDGSSLTNPNADHRRLFLGEDGLLHVKDSAGTVTSPYSGASYVSGEMDYVQFTAPVSITATTEGTANTVVTGASVAYDGSTVVYVEFFAPNAQPEVTATGQAMSFVLLDGASVLAGFYTRIRTPGSAAALQVPINARRRLTPSAGSHQYIVKAFVSTGTGSVNAGAGGTGDYPPGFIRVVKA